MNKEGMEIARGFKDAAIIENLQRAKKTAQAIQRNAIGEFIRFKNTVFAISGIESAQRFEPTEIPSCATTEESAECTTSRFKG